MNEKDEKQLELDLQIEKQIDLTPQATDDAVVLEENTTRVELVEQLTIDALPNFDKRPFSSKKKNKSAILMYVFLAVVCIGVVIYTAYADFSEDTLMPFSEMMQIVGKNWYYLVLAIVSFFLVLTFQGLKISSMLKMTTHKFNFPLGFKTATIGKFYDYVTPLGAGGQPFEIYYLKKHGVELGTATALPLTSFFFSQVVFVILVIIGLVFCPPSINNATIILAIIGVVLCLLVPTLIILFSLMPKLTSRMVGGIIKFLAKIKIVKNTEKLITKSITAVKNNSTCIKTIGKNKLMVVWLLFLSLLMHCSMCSIAYFSLKTFSYDLSAVNGFQEWLEILLMSMILYSAVAFVPTPGNAGASELTFYFMFTMSFTVGGIGFTSMMTWRILSYYSFLLAGAIIIIGSSIKAKRRAKLSNLE